MENICIEIDDSANKNNEFGKDDVPIPEQEQPSLFDSDSFVARQLDYQENYTMPELKKIAEYYDISVLDKNWNKIPFATRDRIVKLTYLNRKKIDIYIKEDDVRFVEFVCTSSKQLKSDVKSTGVKSMICSRIAR